MNHPFDSDDTSPLDIFTTLQATDADDYDDDDDFDDDDDDAPKPRSAVKSAVGARPKLTAAADASGLGGFIRLHTYRTKGRLNLLAAAAGGVLLAAAGPALQHIQPESVPWFALLTAPVFGALALYFFVQFVFAGRVACQIHEAGLVLCTSGGKTYPIPYNSIQSIAFDVVHVTGDDDRYKGRIVLKIAGGEQLKIPVELEDSIEIVNTVMSETFSRLKKEVMAAIDAKQTVSFGAVSVDAESVTLNGKKINWVDGFVWEGEGKVELRTNKTRKGKDTVTSVSRDKVENWHVLDEISDILRSRCGADDDDDDDDDDDFDDDDE